MNGKLIVFEGIDGSGKSTQIELVKKNLEELGINNVVAIKNIGEITIRGRAIREILNTKEEYVNDMAIALLYLSEMLLTAETIKKYLEDGYIVLLDRWYLSTKAYAGTGQNILDVIDIVSNALPKEDLVVLLDVGVHEVLRRINDNRGKTDYYENISKLTTIRNSFLCFIKSYKFKNIPFTIYSGNRLIEDISNSITKDILKLIKGE